MKWKIWSNANITNSTCNTHKTIKIAKLIAIIIHAYHHLWGFFYCYLCPCLQLFMIYNSLTFNFMDGCMDEWLITLKHRLDVPSPSYLDIYHSSILIALIERVIDFKELSELITLLVMCIEYKHWMQYTTQI